MGYHGMVSPGVSLCDLFAGLDLQPMLLVWFSDLLQLYQAEPMYHLKPQLLAYTEC